MKTQLNLVLSCVTHGSNPRTRQRLSRALVHHAAGAVKALLMCSWLASGVSGADVVPTPGLWGMIEYNNNSDSRLKIDLSRQLDLCQDLDQFERLNAGWALNADMFHCTVQNPQPNKLRCAWACDYGYASNDVRYYCGSWYRYPGSEPTPDAQGRDVCNVPSEKNAGPPCCGAGNPINVGTRNKYQREVDYVGGTDYPLRFERSYNSTADVRSTSIGQRWRSNYDRSIVIQANPNMASAFAYRPDGKSFYFTLLKAGSIVPMTPFDPLAAWTPDADLVDRLTQLVDGTGNTTGWQYYVAATEEVETYSATGRLTSVANRAGRAHTLTYDAQGRLSSVQDPFGRSLTFTYDGANRISTLTDPGSHVYTYAYDSVGNLASITYPGTVIRSYVYNEPAFTQSASLPSALTGIIDEKGLRFATFTYASNGDALTTEYAGGQNKYSVSFNTSTWVTTVTDPVGTQRTFTFANVLGAVKSNGTSLPCPFCGSTNSQTITYDANGNVISNLDFNSVQTCYAYDMSRNLQVARVEGVLPTEACSTVLATPPSRPDVRKVSTTWHSTYRLPVTVTEPAPGGFATTINTYDASGNLTQRSVTAPKNDGSGTSVSRTWSWTFATYGRLLTATDPRMNVATMTYYSDADPSLGKRGQLQTATNSAGHVTTYTGYDSDGRVLGLTDPNGLLTSLTYDARGRLLTETAGTEQISYSYDAIGQLTRVTSPDSSYVQYTYDAAHRMTDVQDGLGNRIHYTLDGLGNRIKQETFDPANQLARVNQSVFDSLGRLHQTVGAQ